MSRKTIHIEGRRWFQKTFGNTYNTVEIFCNGKVIATLGFDYGYGEYFLQRAQEWLGKNGYPKLAARNKNGTPKVWLSHWLRENGHSYSVIDVERKRDLHDDRK
jgi:hypothetical protein